MKTYEQFLLQKSQSANEGGFSPTFMPDAAFDFQRYLIEWVQQIGRGAVLADCGLGKSLIEETWGQNIVEKTNQNVLLLTPLAVGQQMVREGEKFGIECYRSRNGSLPIHASIVVTNYEKLHLFDPNDFAAVICDESSILKHFTGATQKGVTRFMSKIPYRLLCTATAAPNDYTELGTSSEALGGLGYSDMLTRFFIMDDKKRSRMNDVKLARDARTGNHYQKLAYRVSQTIGQWRLKGHAELPFWKWVCSWARACRKPSDLGFDDDRFMLPELIERDHVIEAKRPPDGMLFTIPAFGLQEEREERRRTLPERCEYVANLVNHDRPAVVWCHLNDEGDALAKAIPDARQIRGSTPDDEKEEIYDAFSTGKLRVLITKPKIGAWGLNWQHCNHVVTFASHSYEQYYQSIRRCWRFGQTRPVTVDIVSTEGEKSLRDNMKRKSDAAAKMFEMLVEHMNDAMKVHGIQYNTQTERPQWL